MQLCKVPFRLDDVGETWDKQAKHFLYEIYAAYGEHYGHKMRGYFSQGSAIKANPTIEDVLNALRLDTENADVEFTAWCDEFGYDPDSRKAGNIYDQVHKEAAMVRKFFGSDLDLLYQCEQL